MRGLYPREVGLVAKREHLGRGVRFPIGLNVAGGVSTTAFDESVRQSIFIILGTAPGERVMRPEFGCQIHDLVFAPNNVATSMRAEFYCQEAIAKFEPRIEQVKVTARPSADEPNRLDLRIEYLVSDQHDVRSLVYPFYLRSSDGEG